MAAPSLRCDAHFRALGPRGNYLREAGSWKFEHSGEESQQIEQRIEDLSERHAIFLITLVIRIHATSIHGIGNREEAGGCFQLGENRGWWEAIAQQAYLRRGRRNWRKSQGNYWTPAPIAFFLLYPVVLGSMALLLGRDRAALSALDFH